MKRFLNMLEDYEVTLVNEESYRYILTDTSTPSENEIFIGKTDILNTAVVKGLFMYVGTEIYCLSHDDFSYDFLDDENVRLNAAYDDIVSDLGTLGTVPTMPEEVL